MLKVIQGGGFRQRRKATKIDRLKTELSIATMANSELIERMKLLLKVMKLFEDEANWVLKPVGLDEADSQLIWVGEGEPTRIAKAVLDRIRGSKEKFEKIIKEAEKPPQESPVPEGGPASEGNKVVFGPDTNPTGHIKATPD